MRRGREDASEPGTAQERPRSPNNIGLIHTSRVLYKTNIVGIEVGRLGVRHDERGRSASERGVVVVGV